MAPRGEDEGGGSKKKKEKHSNSGMARLLGGRLGSRTTSVNPLQRASLSLSHELLYSLAPFSVLLPWRRLLLLAYTLRLRVS